MMAFDQQLLSRIRNRYAKESPGAGPVRCPDCKPVPATTDAPAKEPPDSSLTLGALNATASNPPNCDRVDRPRSAFPAVNQAVNQPDS